MVSAQRPQDKIEAALPYLLIIAGIVGCIASFVLTYDKIQILQDPSYQPSCNLNPILSCGSVMKTEQANLFGIPNTVFGLVGFSMLFTFGVMLAAGAKVQRWLWLGAEALAIAGVIFVHYLIFQAVFRIQAICPWCFIVWVTTFPVFWYVTLYNLRTGYIRVPRFLQGVISFVIKHHGDVLLFWYTLLFGLLLQHFWYFWSTFL